MGKPRRSSFILISAVAFLFLSLAMADDDDVEQRLEFFMHDNIFVQNPSGIVVAGANGSSSSFTFGTVLVIDDALTQAASPSSKALGRGQGTYMVSALDGSSLLLTFTAVFSETAGTLSFHGADKLSLPTREIAVVGGTGVYRFAYGYAVISTVSSVGFSAVLHFNVTIRVPKSSSSPGTVPSSSSSNSPGGQSSNASAAVATFPSGFFILLLASHLVLKLSCLSLFCFLLSFVGDNVEKGSTLTLRVQAT